MNSIELKELVEKVVVKEGAYSAYAATYGELNRPTFMHRKSIKWIDTKHVQDSQVDVNYLICIPNLATFIQKPAKSAEFLLTTIYPKYELWVDGKKYEEGTTLAEELVKSGLVLLAVVSESSYAIDQTIKDLVAELERQ